MRYFSKIEKFPFSWLLLLLGETILVLGETMWAKLVMGETRYIPQEYRSKILSKIYEFIDFKRVFASKL